MVRELMATGWEPDVVVGASAGALNAVCLAHDWSPECLDRVEALWAGVGVRDIFPGRRFSMVLRLVRREGGLQPSEGLERFLTSNLPVTDLSDTARPALVAVVDLDAGLTRFVGAGPSSPWLAASCSIPGVLAPVEVGGVRYADGGTITPVPLSGALDWGADEVVVCDASEPHWHRRPVAGSLDTLLGAYQAARNEVQRHDIARLTASGARVLWAHVDPHDLEPGDFSRSAELVAEGSRAMREALGRPWQDHLTAAGRLEPMWPGA